MGRIMFSLVVVLVSFIPAIVTAADTNAADETAVRAFTDSYIAAYNRGDAKAVAECWSENGEYVSPSGEKLKGRENIEKEFQAFFAENKGLHVRVSNTSVRFLTPDVAMEDGVAKASRAGEATTQTAFAAVFVRQGGAWKLDSIREIEVPSAPSHAEELKDLEWMIGEWVDEKPESTIETKYEWALNNNFIKSSFKVSAQGEVRMEGQQFIGWDPVAHTIRSWVFDSDGGCGEGTWKQDGNRWVVKWSSILADGKKGTSTNIYTHIDDNSYSWQSIGRQVDGQFMPNIPEVKAVRKASVK